MFNLNPILPTRFDSEHKDCLHGAMLIKAEITSFHPGLIRPIFLIALVLPLLGYHRRGSGGLRLRPPPRPFCSHQQVRPTLQIRYER